MSLRWIFSAMTLRRGVGEFARAERGSVTLQVLLMSIALLGTTGLVLDSGRLYSRHTAMQAYTDAMALAGAAELDGQVDSISRARAAMVGLGDNPYLSKFDSQGNEFKINNIYFFTDLNASSGTSIEMQTLVDSEGFVILDEAEPDQQAAAKYVAVEAVQWRIGTLVGPLQSIVSTPPQGQNWNSEKDGNVVADGSQIDAYVTENSAAEPIPDEIPVQTVAVATLVQQTCAELSTLVLCNPWEQEVGSDTYENQTITGRTIRYFAPNFDALGLDPQRVTPALTGSSLSAIPTPWEYDERNQLHLLVEPQELDPAGVCGLDFVLGFTPSGDDDADEANPDYMKARDRCLLARARPERVCFANTIGVRPAPGDITLEGLNVAFDFWLPPFDALLDAGTGGQIVPNTGSGVPLAAFFEPDDNVLHRWLPVDWRFDNTVAILADGI